MNGGHRYNQPLRETSGVTASQSSLELQCLGRKLGLDECNLRSNASFATSSTRSDATTQCCFSIPRSARGSISSCLTEVSFNAASINLIPAWYSLHYPPTNILEWRSGFTDMAEEYGAEQVIYAHGQSRSRDGFTEWSIDWFSTIFGLEC